MQFQRAANIYFLGVSIIVCLPFSPVQWVSTVLPFCAVLLWTAIKDLYEDIRRKRDDDAENLRRCLRFDYKSRTFEKVTWQEIAWGDILLTLQDEAVPADVLLVRAAEGQAFISTTNLDGETNLKERRPAELLSGLSASRWAGPDVERAVNQDTLAEPIKKVAVQTVEVLLEQGLEVKLDQPCVALDQMYGECSLTTGTKEVAAWLAELKVEQPGHLNHDLFIPRGCVLRNTAYVVSIAAYIGGETKTRLNVARVEAKVSNMQVYLNRFVQGLVLALALFCLYAAIRGAAEKKDSMNPVVRFITYWIILYQVVPISLYVCFEMVKLILGLLINIDPQMMDPRTELYARARTADLVEEMGQVSFIFSDKTGTLTENEMVFAHCSVHGTDLGDFRLSEEERLAAKQDPSIAAVSIGAAEGKRLVQLAQQDVIGAEVRWFFLNLATCHSCQVDLDENGKPHYSSMSPDEVAFLEACESVGVVFKQRRRVPGSSAWELIIQMPGAEGELRFKVVAEIPFSSERKRMSIVCEHEGAYFCISKGADNVMARLVDDPYDDSVQQALMDYSHLGLRTLAVASKVCDRAFVEDWLRQLADAERCGPEGREAALAAVAGLMEQNFTLSGVSAIEDKLQQGVPEAIVSIKAAGIRFWVLTGDKTETAVEIVRSCRLFTPDMCLAYMVNCRTEEDAIRVLEEAKSKLANCGDEGGLVLDGTFTTFALESEKARKLLYGLAIGSRACVCCRLSPQQKRRLVELVREQNPYGITLAIGDGANDVSMIQGAHVGIGVRGKEGNQAVQASDVAISQFRYLVPLLFCHGRRAYRRVATFLCYVIYSHVAVATADIIWAHQSGFAGGIAYPEWLSAAFPTILTLFAKIFILPFDNDLPDEVANSMPELYAEGLHRMRFNPLIVITWMVSAIYHGALAWIVPNLTVGSTNWYDIDFWRSSVCSFTMVVLLVDIKIWILSLNPFSRMVLFILGFSVFCTAVVEFVLGETALGDWMVSRIPGVPSYIYARWTYWRVIILPPLCLLFDLAVTLIVSRVRPYPLDVARRQHGSLFGTPRSTSTKKDQPKE